MIVDNVNENKNDKIIQLKKTGENLLDRGNNLLNDEGETTDEFDFRAKSEKEVIKVPKCTYANDVRSQQYFIFASAVQRIFIQYVKHVLKNVIKNTARHLN